jgi:hypothetical protein
MKKRGLLTKIVGVNVVLFLLFMTAVPLCIADDGSLDDGAETLATLQYSPKSHDFGDYVVGEVTDETTFEIWKGGGCCTVTYQLSENYDWVGVFPTSGSSTGEHDTITVTIDTAGLQPNFYIGLIHITSNVGNGVFTVYLHIVDGPNPNVGYAPTSYDFGQQRIGDTESTTAQIWNTGAGILSYTVSTEYTWAIVTPTSGTTHGEHDLIEITIDTTGLSLGLHTCTITITSDGGTGTISISVTVVEGFPEIRIENIAGAIGAVTAVIKNNGDAPATDIDWSISVQGGFLNRIDVVTSGRIDSLDDGEDAVIQTDAFIFGFGTISVTVNATSADPKTEGGFVFFSFIFL